MSPWSLIYIVVEGGGRCEGVSFSEDEVDMGKVWMFGYDI